jgi:hypothetical protein
VGAAELDIDTLVQRSIDLFGESSKPRGVEVREVDKVRTL